MMFDLNELRAATQSDLNELRAATQSDLNEVRAGMQSDLNGLKAATKLDLNALETRIVEEGEKTRLRFDIMVEKVESAVKFAAEVNSHHSTVVADHEARIQRIEKRSR